MVVSHRGDAEDALRSAVVIGQLSHPAKVRGHVAEPADGVISVTLYDAQYLLILLPGCLQQLRGFIQLNVQFSYIWAFCESNHLK